MVRVADDEGHGHGFAKRTAEPKHHAADDADPREGQHDAAHHFPGGAAQAVGASFSTGGTVSNTSRESK